MHPLSRSFLTLHRCVVPPSAPSPQSGTGLAHASLAIHFVEMIHTRLWWLLPTVLMAGTLEILGWVGRLWSSLNVDAANPYLMQSVFVLSTSHVLLTELVELSPRSSRPRLSSQLTSSFSASSFVG